MRSFISDNVPCRHPYHTSLYKICLALELLVFCLNRVNCHSH